MTILAGQDDGSILAPQLCDMLSIRSPSLYELLHKLEENGYVSQEKVGPGVPRKKVTITPRGRVRALKHRIMIRNRDQLLFGCLDEQERPDLTHILNKLLANWSDDGPHTRADIRHRSDPQ